MDFIKNTLSGGDKSANNEGSTQQESGGITSKLNNMAGGGAKGEQNEDALDKGIDYVQENFLGQGAQNNESAAEQAKDEAISDAIRDQYKSATGKEFFVADKDKKYGA